MGKTKGKPKLSSYGEHRYSNIFHTLAPYVFNGGSSQRFGKPYSIGKIKLILRIQSQHQETEDVKYMEVDGSNRRLTLYKPTLSISYQTNQSQYGPKIFSFDAILDTKHPDHYQELAKTTLPDLINAVINGNDGVLFTHGNTVSNEVMFGQEGLMIYAIYWLFCALKTSKRRFSIKCTSAQINDSELIDLLAKHNKSEDKMNNSNHRNMLNSNWILKDLCEVPCTSAKKAAHFLDLTNRYYQHSSSGSSLIFTLNLYQFEVITTSNGKNTVFGGRSRLHLFDISSQSKNLTDSILAIFNGSKNIPNKENKLVNVLKECLDSMLVWCSIVSNVTNRSSEYLDTLTICQFVTRIHRSLHSHKKIHKRLQIKLNCTEQTSETESETGNCYASSSEHSMDTVIFCGKSLGPLPLSLNTMEKHKEKIRLNNDNTTLTATVTAAAATATLTHKPNKLWIDGHHKKTKRKKSPIDWSKELWIDGPNLDDNTPEILDIAKQQRIKDWISDNTKNWPEKMTTCNHCPIHKITNIETIDMACQTENTSSLAELSPVQMINYNEKLSPQRALPSSLTIASYSNINNFDNNNNNTNTNTNNNNNNNFNIVNSKILSGLINNCNNHKHFCQKTSNDDNISANSNKGDDDNTDDDENSDNVNDDKHIMENLLLNTSEDELEEETMDDVIFDNRIDLDRGLMSECDEICCCKNNEDTENNVNEDNENEFDTKSEPITEPPKQLKLEQFLKQLITITAPNELYTSQINTTSTWTHGMIDVKSRIDEGSRNYLPVIPTSNTIDRILNARSNISLPSKICKQQQQHKRNTTSTTTSGHGTTSDGDDRSSVAKKSTGSKSTGSGQIVSVVQSQPPSSGYDSTIHDEESDHEYHKVKIRGKDKGKGKSKAEEKDKKKRDSTSSDKCSFFCCKWMDLY